MRRGAAWRGALLAVVIGAGAGAGCGPSASSVVKGPGAPTTPAAAAPDRPASPPEDPPIVDGKALEARLVAARGHPVLVNVFASYCEPCRDEMKDLAALAARHPEWLVLGIDVDPERAAFDRFAPLVPRAMRVVRQPGGVAALIASLHLSQDWFEFVRENAPDWKETIPLSFLYDAKGEFVTGAVGRLTPEGLAGFEEVAR